MRILTIAALLLAPFPALAQDFHCRNTGAEIRCVSTGCEVETESFTPMELRRTGNKLSICSYSACWEGPIRMRRSYEGVTFLSASVRISSPGEPNRAPLSVMYDREGVAQIRWLGFSNAMRCGA
ncbi:hypothetical protein [Sphingomonas sp. G-3-2-10]|uniref:hypothetical protein n=1 Tax=Sphingomonas sp. G-3-2-10 TaxID=2728838 RepID=UPI00146E0B2E|nr:hypothetical protein [Sphingomonas sp. G-3-2-10]NML06545.1 hypothetical protein [Sphingomonas sp. G-3-2-10]